MEEDLNVLEEGQVNEGKAGEKDVPQTTAEQRGDAVKRELANGEEEDAKEEGKKRRRSRKSMGLKGKAT